MPNLNTETKFYYIRLQRNCYFDRFIANILPFELLYVLSGSGDAKTNHGLAVSLKIIRQIDRFGDL